MTVVLLVEGATETALKSHLKRFLDQRANQEGKPKLALRTKLFRTMPTEKELRKRLGLELRDIKVRAVIGLLDVYPIFGSAKEVREFICNRIGVKRARPGRNPEQGNNMAPPSKRLGALYQIAKRKYKKPIEMNAILERQDLSLAARECQELRLLLNTLLRLGGLTLL